MLDVKISFVVPNFNEEETIAMCLDSIIRAKGFEDEIIVIDNGSTDNSVDIVKTYSDVILVIKTEATVAAVRNAGVKVASGDILAFIDADCILSNDWRKHLLVMLESTSVAATGSRVGLPEKACWIEKAWYSQRKVSAGKVNYINSGNLVVWKKFFIEVGGFDEELITGEDSEFCWRLEQAGHIVFENPLIEVSHLGNPKSLRSFYKQQRWHGLGMFGTFKISWLDKPVIMTLVFVFCILGALVVILRYGKSLGGYSPLLVVVAIFLVPVVTTLYRCFQYLNFKYFPQLVLLYLLYFVARADSLLRICYRYALQFPSRQI